MNRRQPSEGHHPSLLLQPEPHPLGNIASPPLHALMVPPTRAVPWLCGPAGRALARVPGGPGSRVLFLARAPQVPGKQGGGLCAGGRQPTNVSLSSMLLSSFSSSSSLSNQQKHTYIWKSYVLFPLEKYQNMVTLKAGLKKRGFLAIQAQPPLHFIAAPGSLLWTQLPPRAGKGGKEPSTRATACFSPSNVPPAPVLTGVYIDSIFKNSSSLPVSTFLQGASPCFGTFS